MDELWKDIGESNYQVSTLGNVRSRKTGRILKPKAIQKKGDYICYDVYIADYTGGKQNHHKVHQLVAKAFLPNPNNYTEVDHIDRNTANNQVSNLRWSNRSQQAFNSRTRKDNVLGERNISMARNRFCVRRVGLERAYFDTLEEARAYRDAHQLLKTK